MSSSTSQAESRTIADAVATAKVECSIHPRYFVDHLAFLKTPAHGWQVIAKAYRMVAATASV